MFLIVILFVRMDDDSCVLKYIEIVPLGKSEDSSNVTDVKGEPLSMKVSVVSSFTVHAHSTFMVEFIFVYLIIFIFWLFCYFRSVL